MIQQINLTQIMHQQENKLATIEWRSWWNMMMKPVIKTLSNCIKNPFDSKKFSLPWSLDAYVMFIIDFKTFFCIRPQVQHVPGINSMNN
jgi:hypothetical protein